MQNNEILSLVGTALSLTDAHRVAIFALAGLAITEDEAAALTLEPEADGAVACTDAVLGAFLDGLITDRRGPPEAGPRPRVDRLSNNAVLKKLRIALELEEDDVLRILAAGGRPMSNRELTTLFRKPGTKHYRRCDDDVLRSFLTGLGQ